MDANLALTRLRYFAKDVIDSEDADAAGLAALVNQLDNWLIRGGSLPDDWKPAPRPREGT